MPVFCNQDLALGMPDVAFEARTPAGWVDPNEGGSGEDGRAAQEEIFGNVLEKYPYMEGVAPSPGKEGLCSIAARLDVFTPGPLLVFEEERGGVVLRPIEE